MSKKMVSLTVALFALGALIAPAIASATIVNNSEGELLKVGTEVVAHSHNVAIQTPEGPEVCEYVELRGVLLVNGENEKGEEEVDIASSSPEYRGEARNCRFNDVPRIRKTEDVSIRLGAKSGTVQFSFPVAWEPPDWLQENINADTLLNCNSEIYGPEDTCGTSEIHAEGAMEGGLPGEFFGDFELEEEHGLPIFVMVPEA